MTSADSERLARIETQLDLLVKDLRGNGQPGRCAIQSQRIARLERWRSWMAGAIAVISLVVGAAITFGGVMLAARLK